MPLYTRRTAAIGAGALSLVLLAGTAAVAVVSGILDPAREPRSSRVELAADVDRDVVETGPDLSASTPSASIDATAAASVNGADVAAPSPSSDTTLARATVEPWITVEPEPSARRSRARPPQSTRPRSRQHHRRLRSRRCRQPQRRRLQ